MSQYDPSRSSISLSPAKAGRGGYLAATLAALTLYGTGVLWYGRPAPAPSPGAQVAASPAPSASVPAAETPATQSAATTLSAAATLPNVAAPSVSTVPAPGVALPNVTAPNVTVPNLSAPNLTAPSVTTPATSPNAVVPNIAVPSVSAPTFDVVRILPSGEMLVAGRAAPDSSVELLRNGTRHARVAADDKGMFVITEPALPAGASDLILRFTRPDGRQEVSRQTVTVAVAPDGKEPPVVALASPGLPTVTLSQPAPSLAKPSGVEQPSPASPAAARPSITIVSVEASEAKRLYVSARGAPQASVRLYLNDDYLASALIDNSGAAAFTLEKGIAPGAYRVRLDDVDNVTGAVRSRAEAPFVMPAPAGPVRTATNDIKPPVRPEPSALQPAKLARGLSDVQVSPAPAQPALAVPAIIVAKAATVTMAKRPVRKKPRATVVTRGDSLWTISQRLYGEGERYSVLYDANKKQIRDPNLIYPGQVFVAPRR
jgi:nucleoid-associated protein YgaU